MKSARVWLALIGALGLGVLAGCGNTPGQGTSPARLFLSIETPKEDSATNALRLAVNVSALGTRVERVEVRYEGPQQGAVPLSHERGVWVGALPDGLPSGRYTLKARAVAGSLVEESRPLSFLLDRDPPTVVIAEPASPLQPQAQGNLRVRVQASDAHSGIARVRLFAAGRLLGEQEARQDGEYLFNVDLASLDAGTQSLRVEAVDRAGNAREARIDLVVDREAPTVTWRDPAEGAQVSGPVTLRVRATDNVGVVRVEFFAGANLLETVVVNPPALGGEYTYTWDSTGYSDGPVTLRARAVDATGNFAEATLTVTVANQDKTPPTVVWKAPADGATVSGAVALEVEASDNVGVAKVEFFAGSTKLGEATSAPFTFNWNTLGYPDGPVTLKARAVDAAGNAAEATLTVTVANQDKTPPTVVWKAPADGAVVSEAVTLEVEATDNVGVAKVEFFAGSTKLGEATTAPYTFSWNTTGYPDGPVTLKARAVDAAGNASEATLTVTVANAPTVVWMNPVPHQKVTGFVNLQAEVRAIRPVSHVDFYFGSDENSLAKISGSPSVSGNVYTLGWDILRVTPGNYILQVVVEDSAGSRGVATIPVEVMSTFVITTPADGDGVGLGAGRQIVAITVGVNGTLPPGVTVSRVEILINSCAVADARQEIAGDGSYVYVYPWDTAQTLSCRSDPSQIAHDPTKPGDRVITARVYYTGGDTFTGGVLVTYSP